MKFYHKKSGSLTITEGVGQATLTWAPPKTTIYFLTSPRLRLNPEKLPLRQATCYSFILSVLYSLEVLNLDVPPYVKLGKQTIYSYKPMIGVVKSVIILLYVYIMYTQSLGHKKMLYIRIITCIILVFNQITIISVNMFNIIILLLIYNNTPLSSFNR